MLLTDVSNVTSICVTGVEELHEGNKKGGPGLRPRTALNGIFLIYLWSTRSLKNFISVAPNGIVTALVNAGRTDSMFV